VSTWIYTIARNTLTDYFRTRKTYADIDSIVEPVAGDDDPEDVTVGNETTEELAFALEKLDENERDLIIMCYYHGMKLIDTAEKMHVTYSQAKRIRNKALLKMRQYIPCEYSAVPAEAVN
jgi:RNA polymerase sigma-70 factor (ECF subfamily)